MCANIDDFFFNCIVINNSGIDDLQGVKSISHPGYFLIRNHKS